MSEARKEVRKKVATFTPVRDHDAHALLGYLGNLTLIGALLVSEDPIETGRQVTLDVEFRESSEIPADARIVIPAHVVWCELEPHRTYYGVGLEFIKVSEEDKIVIEAALKKYEFIRGMPG